MKRKIYFAILSFLLYNLWLPVSATWGFSFTSPAPNARVEAGSMVQASLDVENAESFAGVMFTAYGEHGKLLGGNFVVEQPYTWTLQLPPDYTGPATITATGKVLNRKTTSPPESNVTIYVKLPAFVVVQGIRTGDDQTLLFMRPYATRKLSVYGQYSDGVERDISSGQSGTTYDSSNKTVALVDANGVVTARVPGKVQIIVKNGTNELAVTVVVQLKP